MNALARIEKAKTRLASKSISNGECLEYTGPLNNCGYGKMWFENKTDYAHRVSYILYKTSIDSGLQVDHTCRNRKCVKPEHLELVTPKENIARTIPYRTDAFYNRSGRAKVCQHNNSELYTNGQCKPCNRERRKQYNKAYLLRKKGI